MVSLYSGLKVAQTLPPILASSTAHATGIATEVKGFRECLMIIHVGTGLTNLSGSVYWTFTFEECDVTTAGSFTHIADADLEGGAHSVVIDDTTEDAQTLTRNYRGAKRYVRMVGTLTGTNTNGTPIGMLCILGDPQYIPVTQATEVQAA